jgi:hypothetical protein
MIFASPLTRATQTALITLHGHRTLAQQGLTLLASAREIKNFGGQDTVGQNTGEQASSPLRTATLQSVLTPRNWTGV